MIMGEAKKLNKNTIEDLIDKIRMGDKSIYGEYLFKGLRVLVRYTEPLPLKERYKRLYERRRSRGQCVQCGIPVTEKNPRTKKPYRYCEEHRKEESSRRKKSREDKSISKKNTKKSVNSSTKTPKKRSSQVKTVKSRSTSKNSSKKKSTTNAKTIKSRRK
jgi:hypothetical protein